MCGRQAFDLSDHGWHVERGIGRRARHPDRVCGLQAATDGDCGAGDLAQVGIAK